MNRAPGTGSRPIRVFHVIETLRSGGAEQLLLTTVRALAPARVASFVACLFPPLTLRGELERAGATVYPLGLRGRLDWRRGVLELARLLRAARADLVHTHLFYANCYGRVAARLAGRLPVITTLHSLDYTYQDTGTLRFKLRKLLDRHTAHRLTTRHLAVSRAVRDDYRRHLGLEGIDVLYNYVEPAPDQGSDLERRARRRALLGGDGDFVVLNVGRLHWEKGQRFLVEAMPHVVRKVPSARLVLLGGGPDEADLKSLAAQSGVEDAVVFLGEQADVRSWLASADVFALPSNFEGLPISLLEAMAAGLPVVATRTGGIPEVVDDGVNGLLVAPADPDAIAAAVVRLHENDDLRRALGARAIETVARRFAATTQVRRLESLYESVIDAPTGGGGAARW